MIRGMCAWAWGSTLCGVLQVAERERYLGPVLSSAFGFLVAASR